MLLVPPDDHGAVVVPGEKEGFTAGDADLTDMSDLAFDGKPVDGFMGALPESKVNEFINRVASPDGDRDAAVEEAMTLAKQAADIGHIEQATQISPSSAS